jgi:integrase
MATIPKRLPNGRVRIQVYLGRHPVTRKHQFKSGTFDTKKAANKWARKYETKKDNNEQVTIDKRTFAEYLTQWLALKETGAVARRDGKKKRIGPRTLDDYRRLLTDWILQPKPAHNLPHTGQVRLDKLTFEHLNALYRAMEQVTAEGTVRKLNGLLGQVFFEVEQKGILARNPAEWANVPLKDDPEGDDDNASAKAMDQEQARAFLDAARAFADAEGDEPRAMPERCWSALWHVLCTGGLRPGEAFALQWDDVHEIGHAVQVRHNLVRIRGKRGYELRKPKTKKSRRTVELPESTWKELMLWKKAQRWSQQPAAGDEWQDLGFVFTTSKGTPLHSGRRSFERVCAKAGLGKCGKEHVRAECWCQERHGISGPLPAPEFTPEFRIYDLRHTSVTLELANGVPVNVVADRHGHENAAFTIARYGHSLPQQHREQVKKMESVFFKMA